MKKFLTITLLLILSVVLFESNVFGQTIGDLRGGSILTTTLESDDTDTLVFRLFPRTDSDRTMGLWVLTDYTDGAADSTTIQFLEAVNLDSQGENSEGLTDVVTDTALVDSSWHGFIITPVYSEFLKVLVGHAMLTGGPDTSVVSIQLIYR